MCYYKDFMHKRILLFLITAILLFYNTSTLSEGPKNYLKGKYFESVKDNFLIATEKMTDNRFSKTVIVMLENNEEGAWGLVVNKFLGEIKELKAVQRKVQILKEMISLNQYKFCLICEEYLCHSAYL